MPDITITLTDEEVLVAESFSETVQDGAEKLLHRKIKSLAKTIIEESTSQLDPAKLSAAELRDEINRLDGLGEIPTYAERYPGEG